MALADSSLSRWTASSVTGQSPRILPEGGADVPDLVGGAGIGLFPLPRKVGGESLSHTCWVPVARSPCGCMGSAPFPCSARAAEAAQA